MDKADFRISAKNIRKSLDTKAISHKICEKIRNHNIYKSSQNVMIFYPLKYEIDLLELLEDDKNFYLPKVSSITLARNIILAGEGAGVSELASCTHAGEGILVCPYSKNLKKSDLNILEPCTDPVNPEILDLIFVPALMVDKENYRLGYGGGFYDRFLAKYPDIKTIAPIAEELIVDKLPHDEFDIKIDEIIFAK